MFWKADVKEAPFSAPTLPGVPGTEKMLYFWLSDYLFNTAMFAAQQNDFFKVNLSAADVSVLIKDIAYI